MPIVFLGDSLHDMPNAIFQEEPEILYSKWRLLKFLPSMQRVNIFLLCLLHSDGISVLILNDCAG